MKKNLKTIIILIVSLLFVFLLIGCKSKPDVEKEKAEEAKKTTTVKLELPDWFLNPPSEKDVLYAVGFSKKQNMQNALNDASTSARAEISRVISVKVSTMTKQFLEEAGVGKEVQATDFTQSITRTLSNNVLSGSKIDKQDIKQAGDAYSVCVLVKLSLDDMAKMYEQAMKLNAAAYNDLAKKVNKGFDELTKEVDKLEGKDFEKPSTPKVE